MKKTLVLVAALALIAAVPASAGSRHPQRGKIVRLTKANRNLRHRLHKMILARNAARRLLAKERAKSATLETQATSLQGQNATLEARLSQVTSERNGLQNRLNSIPTALQIAIEQVRREVYWAQRGSSLSYGRLIAQSAMNYAVGHVSTAAFGYRTLMGIPNDLSTPNDILSAQAGVCGKASYAFAAIVHAFGLPVRRVLFYWTLANGTPDSHTAVEVYYDGGWHFFDPTFGVTWLGQDGNVLSIAAARGSSPTEQKDTNSFTNLIEDPWFAGDDVAFQLDPATTVVDPGEPFYL